jgi:hypothetical protein
MGNYRLFTNLITIAMKNFNEVLDALNKSNDKTHKSVYDLAITDNKVYNKLREAHLYMKFSTRFNMFLILLGLVRLSELFITINTLILVFAPHKYRLDVLKKIISLTGNTSNAIIFCNSVKRRGIIRVSVTIGLVVGMLLRLLI